MASDLLSEILRGALGGASGVPTASGASSGLGGVLGSLFGGSPESQADAGAAAGHPGQSMLVASLLPLAIRWMQSNGGLGAVLQRFEQHGYGEQAASWVSTGANQPVDAQAVNEVVGTETLSKLAQQLGVPHEQVAGGLAQILPQLVNHVTPAGEVPSDANNALGASLAAVEQFLRNAPTPPA